MKIKAFTAWMAKDVFPIKWNNFGNYWLLGVDDFHKTKGNEGDWYAREWPPIKIKITIEVED